MEKISSTEFRKSFQRLPDPIVVTVNGYPIGIWDPRIVTDGAGNILEVTATEFSDGRGNSFRRQEPEPDTGAS